MQKHLRAAVWTGLLSLGLWACGEDSKPAATNATFDLNFVAQMNGEALACDQSYSDVGAGDATVVLQDLRMYVSSLRFITQEGQEVAATLEANAWQSGDTALLDFEDATGACDAAGSEASHTKLTGTVPSEHTYTGVAFDVGVPFASNHTDVATAQAPLDVAAMAWVWQKGRKFMRFELVRPDASSNGTWVFHLGSTACASDSAEVAPAEACGRPNRATIQLGDMDPLAESVPSISLDVGRMLQGIDISQNTPETPAGCMSGLNDADDCTPVFAGLGMDFATGACANNCEEQTLFEVVR